MILLLACACVLAGQVLCNMTVARRGLGLCVLPGTEGGQDRLFAAGGQDDEPTKSVEYFDQGAGAWKALAPMGERRLNFGFAALDGCLYVIGGWDGEVILQTCEKYYPDRDEWVEIAVPTTHSFCFLASCRVIAWRAPRHVETKIKLTNGRFVVSTCPYRPAPPSVMVVHDGTNVDFSLSLVACSRRSFPGLCV